MLGNSYRWDLSRHEFRQSHGHFCGWLNRRGIELSTAGTDRAFRWNRSDGIKPLPELAGGPVSSQAFGVSRDGSVMVGYSFSSNAEALKPRWPASGGVIAMGDLPGGIFDANAMGVSAMARSSSDTATITPASILSAGLPPPECKVLAYRIEHPRISDDGKVIVGRQSPNFQSQLPTAFMWTQPGGTEFLWRSSRRDPILRRIRRLRPTAQQSSVFHPRRATNGEPFRWTRASGMQPLPNTPIPFASQAFDVSGNGSTIVGFASYAGDQQAFVRDQVNGLRDLKTFLIASGINMGTWSLREATAISDDGRIITGWGVDPAGQTEPWVAVIPEPASLLILLALSDILSRRRAVNEKISRAQPTIEAKEPA
jgi:uncharacterized membrane protein